MADKIELVEPEHLEDALYALGNTFNRKYVPIFIRYENHENPFVRSTVKETLIEFSKLNTIHNE